ncbi:hypothetical protein LR48_Vigan125s000800 [Vigna angularis]|uniref:Uncharacterized protein n=1 Tax=Phaseolus angularis TaxID=3914 RepID=A0A0L9T4W5_PHAAN|nr:hypothetical protein LR48_Vigan125s000800 [Vigna angularis]
MLGSQSVVKATFLAAAIRKCGGNEEKGNVLYNAYGSNEQWREDTSTVAMEIIAHPQQNSYNQVNNLNPQFVQVVNNHGSCEELYSFPTHSSALEKGHHDHQFHYSTPTPDLLNLLHLPMTFENQSTNLPKLFGPMGTTDSINVSSVSYDPFLHLNLQAPPPALGNDFAFGGGGVIQGSGIAYQDFGNGLVEFTQDVGKKRGGKRTNQFTTPSIASEGVVEDLVTQRHCPGYAASSMPRRPISSLDNGSLQLSHPPPSSAQNTAKRYKRKALSSTLGALNAKVSYLTLGCPFLEPSAQDVPGSRPGALVRGAERNYDETHYTCLPSELTLSATSDPHTAERHKWGIEGQSRGLGPVFCYFYVIFKDLHVLGFVSLDEIGSETHFSLP